MVLTGQLFCMSGSFLETSMLQFVVVLDSTSETEKKSATIPPFSLRKLTLASLLFASLPLT